MKHTGIHAALALTVVLATWSYAEADEVIQGADERLESEYFTIQHQGTGDVLTETIFGFPVVQGNHGGDNQKWRFLVPPNGFDARIQVKSSGKCLRRYVHPELGHFGVTGACTGYDTLRPGSELVFAANPFDSFVIKDYRLKKERDFYLVAHKRNSILPIERLFKADKPADRWRRLE